MAEAAASPLAGATPVASLAHTDGVVTLVDGQTFALSGRTGDLSADSPHGLFVLDTRLLSRWELRIDGHRLEPLTVDLTEPHAGTFVGRAHPAAGRADAEVVVFRDRAVGAGMREVVSVHNHGLDAVEIDLVLRCEVDFADLFEVKELRVQAPPASVSTVPGGIDVRAAPPRDDVVRVRAEPEPVAVDGDGDLHWRLGIPSGGLRVVELVVDAVLDGHAWVPSSHVAGGASRAAARLAAWRRTVATAATGDRAFDRALDRAVDDLGALQLEDPDLPGVATVAAGAPWFMTLFGRDSLLTSWMALLVDPRLAAATAAVLARRQGRDVDPRTEEEPGRILHEARFGPTSRLALGGGGTYYGSVDATPLFVVLVGELQRWGTDPDAVDDLRPHVERALDWIDGFGDADGDGFVEYRRRSDRGLANQGWKDSWDAIRHADGTLAEPPIALCEVQGYVYAARLAAAELAAAVADTAAEHRHRQAAADLRARFHEAFWLDDLGTFALALDGRKRPVRVATSNPGHCLWAGIAHPGPAERVARGLLGPDLFSGWGIRTLAASSRAYNPVSYHNGSVWPHDNAIAVAGLVRYGHLEAAHRLVAAQLDVAGVGGGRLPELFAGFERGRPASPAAYPASCSPQAWASAAPLLWLRSLLRLDPVDGGRALHLAPVLPDWLREVHLDRVAVGGERLRIEVVDGRVSVSGGGSLPVLLTPRSVP